MAAILHMEIVYRMVITLNGHISPVPVLREFLNSAVHVKITKNVDCLWRGERAIGIC